MKTLTVTTILCGAVLVSIFTASKVKKDPKQAAVGGYVVNTRMKMNAAEVYPAQHLGITIARSPEDVYKFVSDGMNLPKWAEGLSGAKIEKSGDAWLADSPMGKVRVKFAPENSYGIVDHDVTLPSGEVNHNPLRILKNGAASEVVFTLYRLPRMSDQEFSRDVRLIEKDLATLKRLLEDGV